jgi:hypothetical protein
VPDCTTTPVVAGWIGPVIGAGIAFCGVSLTHFFSTRWRKQDRQWRLQEDMRVTLLERGEELYTLLHNWNVSFANGVNAYKRVMSGEIDYNWALDIVIQGASEDRHRFERIGLLIHVYFPSLRVNWEIAESRVHTSSSIESNFRAAYKKGISESSEHLQVYTGVAATAAQKLEELTRDLAELLRKRADAPSSA